MTFPRLAVKFVVSNAPAGAEEEDGDAAVLEHHNASQQNEPAGHPRSGGGALDNSS